jgi:glyoxylase-like metal-dependent hydrolase (beta-lactamase superfamily II)
MQRWTIGDVTITRIVEQTIEGTLDGLIPMATPEHVLPHAWLVPDHVLADGRLRFSVHALGIEADGKRIVVDTCVGNGRDRPAAPFWSRLSNPFLDDLTAAGFAPESVDLVVCTHLHLDHVGWNTRREGDRWVPTFPHARYLMGRVDYAHEVAELAVPAPSDMLAPTKAAVFGDAIRPVVDAGLVDLVETDHVLCPSVRLLPTPGHTQGHVSVVIESRGARAVITGDAIHHPCQLVHPEWGALVDADHIMTVATRRTMLDGAVADRSLLIGSHWAGSSCGHIVRESGGYRLTEAQPELIG